ncbi:MAG: aminoacyl-tRNA hydrolase [Chloroflexi bacterium]|nr:aminoacyl-tRNA hydrolase [Chloroflexota bacterium]MBP8055635.1 aminoacyl-tRNA hydrolase [Chloroflexota bacterium]
MIEPSDDNRLAINNELTIPLAELNFRFAASSGPGGQHVNKAETKVVVLFDVAHSPSLSEWQRGRILTQLASRLDKDGILAVTSQIHRSQHQNRAEALQRLQTLLAEALKVQKKRHPTKPSLASQERRHVAKKKRGEIKRGRGRNWLREE